MAGEGANNLYGKVTESQARKIEAPDKLGIKMEEFRCQGCNRVLALVAMIEGTIVVKCKRCRAWNALDIQSTIYDNEN